MTARGDTLTLGVLAAFAAGAAWSVRRGGRNEYEAQERQVFHALFPGMEDLNEVQLNAMKVGRLVFPDGREATSGQVYMLEDLVVLREARADPELQPTVRGPKFSRHRISVNEGERNDTVQPGILGGVLELRREEDDFYGWFYLPYDKVEISKRYTALRPR